MHEENIQDTQGEGAFVSLPSSWARACSLQWGPWWRIQREQRRQSAICSTWSSPFSRACIERQAEHWSQNQCTVSVSKRKSNPLHNMQDFVKIHVTPIFVLWKKSNSFIPDISISPLLFRGTPDYSIDTVSELTRWRATGNCQRRTCPRSLRGLEWDSNLQPSRHKAPNLPLSHYASTVAEPFQTSMYWIGNQYTSGSSKGQGDSQNLTLMTKFSKSWKGW